MKIAIDSGPLRSGDSVRGIGVYTRELLGALTSLQKVDKKIFEVRPVDYFNHRTIVEHYDVIHFTRFNPFRVSLPFAKPNKTKFVLTVYDLIPLIYPDHYPPGIKGKINWYINKYLIKKNVDAVITISETSKKDICRFIGIDPKKVFVTYLAPRSVFKKLEVSDFKLEIAKQYHLPNRFALYVGDINYNKNIPVLTEACRLAKIPLVVCGKQSANIESLDLNHPELRHLKDVNWIGVNRLGFVPDADLVKIYNLATVFVQPSLYEGFGLPVLEAQATGTPVVASKTQALVEIAENSALFNTPSDAVEMAEKIKFLFNDSIAASKFRDKGKENVKKYSWQKTAQKTLEIYSTL